MKDYSLSPAFDTRGINNLKVSGNTFTNVPLYVDGARNYIEIDEDTYLLDGSTLENVKGTVRISEDINPIQPNSVNPIGIEFKFDLNVLEELKKYCRGFFIVRQKRIPTILAQALTVYLDQNSYLPCLKYSKDNGFVESFIDSNRLLTHDFNKRILQTNNVRTEAAICPEAELKLPFFNQLFTGSEFTITKAPNQPASDLEAQDFDLRYYYVNNYKNLGEEIKAIQGIKITLVEDGTKMTTSGTQKFSARAGEAEEAWRVSYVRKDSLDTAATNIVRGDFGTYIGIEDFNGYNNIINIRIPEYNDSRMNQYFRIRFVDETPFSAVSERVDLSERTVGNLVCYRGDCYVGNFTHRMQRNFQDPEAPVNDLIVDETTWKENYSIDNAEKNADINRGDVNAVEIGH